MKPSLRLPRPEIIVIAAAAVLAAIVTLAVLASRSGGKERRLVEQAREEQKSAQAIPALSAEDLSLTPEDFLLPGPPQDDATPDYHPFRPPLSRWGSEIVRKYWVPPREIAIDIVSRINDQDMERLFESVP